MHIAIGHNLLPFFAFFLSPRGGHGRKKIGGFSSLWLRNFLRFLRPARPMRDVEQANKTSPRFHPGQTSELSAAFSG